MAEVLSSLKEVVKSAIDAKATDLHQISKDIWNAPELAYEEHKAHALLCNYLEKSGFSVKRHHNVDTAFLATYSNGEGPNVAVLCEYDALPGIGHACGHNLIAEVGIAASLAIKAAMEKYPEKLKGKLEVFGTPAEEDKGGKIDFIEKDDFKNVSIALMAHPTPHTITELPISVLETVNVTYRGRASHAAAFPWDGVNALDAAVMAYTSISHLRQQMKPTWRVHGVITNGGEKPNIIPEEASLQYYLRTPTMSDIGVLKEKATACFQAAATATGCTVELEWDPRPYENLLFNKTLCNLYETNALDLGVQFTDTTNMTIPTGSTDMGNVSHVVPSIHPFFHIGSYAPNHTRDFTAAAGADAAQPYTLAQGKALAMTAIDVLFDPSLLKQITTDFEKDLEHDQRQ